VYKNFLISSLLLESMLESDLTLLSEDSKFVKLLEEAKKRFSDKYDKLLPAARQ
jgi:hypothetical protein